MVTAQFKGPSETQIQAAIAEDQGPGVDVSAQTSQRYRNQFGRFTRPVAPAAVTAEEGMMTVQMEEERAHPTHVRRFLLTSPATYLFRSDPGHRVVALRIPGVPQCRIEKHQEFFQRKYEKKYAKRERDRFEKLADLAGGMTITFTEIARKQECYYETDEKLVADFILAEMEAGRLPQVYQDAPAKAAEEALPTHRAQAAMRLRLLHQESALAATGD